MLGKTNAVPAAESKININDMHVNIENQLAETVSFQYREPNNGASKTITIYKSGPVDVQIDATKSFSVMPDIYDGANYCSWDSMISTICILPYGIHHEYLYGHGG